MQAISHELTYLFFPTKAPEKEITLKTANEYLMRQKIARIAKAAFFLLSSIATTVTLVLTEAMIITWPLALPAIFVSIVSMIIFYRLNSLDQAYTERLTPNIRSQLAKMECEKILFSKEDCTQSEINSSFQLMNKLLSYEIFDDAFKKKIVDINEKRLQSSHKESIAEFAYQHQIELSLDTNLEWIEEGRFGLSSYKHITIAKWDGNPATSIEINYNMDPHLTS